MESQDDSEEVTEKKINNKVILTEEEVLKTINMTLYKERIENIIGRNYSYLFFDYFDIIYHSKIKNKISDPLNFVLNKTNKKENSLWMNIYKSIKFYSKENLPIFITKYFWLKANIEFKYIYNESKKYTKNTSKFIDIYIKKMKKNNDKKLNDLKSKNNELDNIFKINSKNNFIRNLSINKSLLKKKKSDKINLFNKFNNNEGHSDSSTKEEEEIKHKKEMRTQIMRQIHQLKIKAIKEIEKTNNIQNKQKKKYGGIKSRFLNFFGKQNNYLTKTTFQSSKKIYHNIYKNFIFNKYKENDELFHKSLQVKNSINTSKISYNNNYPKKKINLLIEEKQNNNKYYLNSLTNSKRKDRNNYRYSLRSNKTNFEGISNYNDNNKNKLSLFSYDMNYKFNENKTQNLYNHYLLPNKKGNDINKLKIIFNLKQKYKLRPKSSLIQKKAESKLFLKKLEEKQNKEFLNTLINRNYIDDYSTKMYDLFKKTDYF